MWTLGLVMMVSVLVGVTRLKPAVPTVERGSLWTDVVAHGEMKREVHGSGNLQPEHVLIISALTGGRVEALPVRPGERVTPTTEIVQLSNTDVELQALGAEQQLTQAQSALASLRTALVQQLLSEEKRAGGDHGAIQGCNAQRVRTGGARLPGRRSQAGRRQRSRPCRRGEDPIGRRKATARRDDCL